MSQTERDDLFDELVEALKYCQMTLADIETSKRKGYIHQANRLAAAALAKANPETSANFKRALSDVSKMDSKGAA
jgi:alpha-galactosidase/6-phospho-beta-glucosidase family protein